MDAHFDAFDVSEDLRTPADERRYRFGVSNARTVKALRALADAIEAGEAAIQVVRTHQAVTLDAFALRTVVIKYAAKGPAGETGE